MVAVSVIDDNGRALPLSGCGFFFFFCNLVDLMVVVGCGLWVVIVAVVVGCGGDGRWCLSLLLMIMGELYLSLVLGFFFFLLQFG